MKTRYVIALGTALLAMVGVAIAQQKTSPMVVVPVAPSQSQVIPQLDVPTGPQRSALPLSPGQDPLVVAVPRQQVVSAKPEELTIDHLIEAVDGFREQKAELEKKEKAYLKVLHRKAEKQKERIDGLGGAATNAQPTLLPGPVAPAYAN